MKHICIEMVGGPEVLTLQEAPDPVPATGEVLVQLAAAGINFIDIYQRTGQYPVPLPFTPGLEGAGVVEAVGEDVHEFKPGDRVAFAFSSGAYADKVVVPAQKLVPVPAGVSLEQAAALMLQGMTAHYLSASTFPLQAGQTALVHAAAGGVGLLLIQLARQRGARVLGTASTAEKAAMARAAGAEEVVRYGEEDFAAAARRFTGGKGVDVVYDSVGKATFHRSLEALKPRGTLVLYGQSSGPVSAFDPQELNAKGSLFLTRPSLGHYVATREELLWRATELFEAVQGGQLSVRIHQAWPLAEAGLAQQALASRGTAGKLLLHPDGV